MPTEHAHWHNTSVAVPVCVRREHRRYKCSCECGWERDEQKNPPLTRPCHSRAPEHATEHRRTLLPDNATKQQSPLRNPSCSDTANSTSNRIQLRIQYKLGIILTQLRILGRTSGACFLRWGKRALSPPAEATEAPPWQVISPRSMRFGQCPLGAHSIPPPRVGVISNAHSPLTPRDGPREAAPSCCTSEVPEGYGEPPPRPRGRSCLTPARELLRRESWTGLPLTGDAREAGGRHQRAGLKTCTRCRAPDAIGGWV